MSYLSWQLSRQDVTPTVGSLLTTIFEDSLSSISVRNRIRSALLGTVVAVMALPSIASPASAERAPLTRAELESFCSVERLDGAGLSDADILRRCITVHSMEQNCGYVGQGLSEGELRRRCGVPPAPPALPRAPSSSPTVNASRSSPTVSEPSSDRYGLRAYPPDAQQTLLTGMRLAQAGDSLACMRTALAGARTFPEQAYGMLSLAARCAEAAGNQNAAISAWSEALRYDQDPEQQQRIRNAVQRVRGGNLRSFDAGSLNNEIHYVERAFAASGGHAAPNQRASASVSRENAQNQRAASSSSQNSEEFLRRNAAANGASMQAASAIKRCVTLTDRGFVSDGIGYVYMYKNTCELIFEVDILCPGSKVKSPDMITPTRQHEGFALSNCNRPGQPKVFATSVRPAPKQ